MIRALSTAATGLEAQSANIERISNDLANVNTDGYKKSKNEFHELMYETIKEPGAQLGASTQSPVGIQNGLGVKVGSVHKVFEQGPARMTGHPYDFMIEGKGFFPVQMPNGEIVYTRHGAFHLDSQARLTQANGSMLIPQITIPQLAKEVKVAPNGEVKAVLAPNNEEVVLGQLQLVTFTNESGLSAAGEGVYKVTQASGPPLQGVPGEAGLGIIAQAALEGSNVNVANSMIEMIQTQRAYEMNTKVMGVADKMLEATVNIK